MREKLQLENLTLEWDAEDIALLRLDMPGKSANIINERLQDDLEQALDHLDLTSGLLGAVLYSAKDKIFVAGADLTQIVRTQDWSDEEIHRFCERGQRLFDRFQSSRWTTVAAIHGACVGGGLELALGCSLQIASDDRRTSLGLPETKLGLVPGWAGTVRVPRLVGLKTGIDLIAHSTLFGPEKALELGIVNRVVPRGNLISAALEMIRSDAWRELGRQRSAIQHAPCREGLDDRIALSEEWANFQGEPGGIHPFAPKVVAQHILASAESSFLDACRSEQQAMARVYGKPPSRGLLNVFFLNEHQRKSLGFYSASSDPVAPITHVAIIGAGVMGQAIARSVANGKTRVTMFDMDRGKVDLFVGAENRPDLSVAPKLADLFPCDLVLECIAEDVTAKQKLFSELATLADPATILATNTSAIGLQAIFAAVPHPERMLGIHYCHPQLMQLVEVVRHPKSSDAVVHRAVRWLQEQRKTPLVVRDSPGFVVNRVLTALIDAAVGIFEEGTPLPKIDQAIEDFGFLGGPFKIMDTIGLDTVVLAGRALASQGIQQVSPSPLLPMLVKKKRLGRKSLAGFYLYKDAQGTAEVDHELLDMIHVYQRAATNLNPQEIVERVLANMLIATGEILERHVVSSPKDIDVAVIQGLSFPAHAGGLLFWAHQADAESLSDALIWNLKRRPSLCLPRCLADWQQQREPFYQTIDGA